MSRIGCLGNIVFTVSSERVETINNLQWSGSARYSEHQRHLSAALTEFTGTDPDKLSFDIILSAYLGVDPMKEIKKLAQYERDGKAVSLVIGDKSYGRYRWTIRGHKIAAKNFDGHGNLINATVSVDLLEYLKS